MYKIHSRMHVIIIGFILLAVTLAAYSRVIDCGFVDLDDPIYVSKNIDVQRGICWSGWCYAWTTWDGGYFQPLTWLSLELDSTCWGTKPMGYHITNVLLHAVNCILLFILLNKSTGCVTQSSIVAALFALHPLHVESVAWITERKDVLSTFFLLLSVLMYIQYAISPSVSRFLSVMVLFALGLWAKPMLVTLPILMLLLDWWPLGRVDGYTERNAHLTLPCRSRRILLIEKLPLLVMSFIAGLVTIFAQRHVSATVTFHELPVSLRLSNAFSACYWYLHATLFPVNLTAYYPLPGRELNWGHVAFGAVIVGAASVYCLRNFRSKPYLIVGWSWFVISLLPVLGFLQVGGQAYADRFVYVPHIGLFICVVWECHSWLQRTSSSRIGWMICAVVFTICGILTHAQVAHWANSEALWSHAVKVDPTNFYALWGLGDSRAAVGDYDGAVKYLSLAADTPNGSKVTATQLSCGRYLLKTGRPVEAEERFRAALGLDSRRAVLRLDSSHAATLGELVLLLLKQGREKEAAEVMAQYERVMVQCGSGLTRAEITYLDDSKTILQMGLAQARQGKLKQAVVSFEEAIRLAPSGAAHNNLGQALQQLHRLEEAKENYRRAIALNPELAAAHFNLGQCLESENDLAGARTHFTEALRLDPADNESGLRLKRLTDR